MFSQLEEVNDKLSEEMVRKGKKLREIARLKLKNESFLTEEERIIFIICYDENHVFQKNYQYN